MINLKVILSLTKKMYVIYDKNKLVAEDDWRSEKDNKKIMHKSNYLK